MKTRFLIGLAATVLAQNSMAFDKTAKVLEQLDSICADSWCAGDFNFRFDKLQCGDEACRLDLAIKPYLPETKEWKNFSCEWTGWNQDELFEGDGETVRYSAKLYDAVGDCLRNQQQKMPKPLLTPALCSAPGIYRSSSAAFEDSALSREIAAALSLRDSNLPACKAEEIANVSCTEVGLLKTVCLIEQAKVSAFLIRDQVDSSSLIVFHPGKAPKLDLTEGMVPEVSDCYEDMITTGDHRSVFITDSLPKNDSQLAWNQLLPRSLPKSCPNKFAKADVQCKTLGSYSLCSSASDRGIFLLGTLSAKRAFSTFVRFD